jgi:hypothetical protein
MLAKYGQRAARYLVLFVVVIAYCQRALAAQEDMTIKALLDEQASNITRVYNGRCASASSLRMDYGLLKNLGRSEIHESAFKNEQLMFIGPPGGYFRCEQTREPLMVNGEPYKGEQRTFVQHYWDTERRVEYMPDQKFARLTMKKDTDSGFWRAMHPLFYGLTYRGGTLDELRNELPEVRVLNDGSIGDVVEMEFAGSVPPGTGTRTRVVLDMDKNKNLFILGYKKYALPAGNENEIPVEAVRIEPAEAQPGLWFPAKIDIDLYRAAREKSGALSAQLFGHQSVEFMPVDPKVGFELNMRQLAPKDLQLTIPNGVRLADISTGIQYTIGDSIAVLDEAMDNLLQIKAGKVGHQSFNEEPEGLAPGSGSVAAALRGMRTSQVNRSGLLVWFAWGGMGVLGIMLGLVLARRLTSGRKG